MGLLNSLSTASPRALLLVLPLLALLGCKEDPAALKARWNAAVAQRNGSAAWKLLDAPTRQRIREGLTRSQAKAKQDAAFQHLFVRLCAPADSAQSPETLAKALLSNPDLALPDASGASPEPWKPEPVGFCAPDGCPLTLGIRLGRPPTSPSPIGFRMTVDYNGKTAEECRRAYATRILSLAPELGWTPLCASQAGRIMGIYSDDLIPRQAFGLSIQVDGRGSLTAVFDAFNPSLLRNEVKADPSLTYLPWP